jgi:hypothetical protein
VCPDRQQIGCALVLELNLGDIIFGWTGTTDLVYLGYNIDHQLTSRISGPTMFALALLGVGSALGASVAVGHSGSHMVSTASTIRRGKPFPVYSEQFQVSACVCSSCSVNPPCLTGYSGGVASGAAPHWSTYLDFVCVVLTAPSIWYPHHSVCSTHCAGQDDRIGSCTRNSRPADDRARPPCPEISDGRGRCSRPRAPRGDPVSRVKYTRISVRCVVHGSCCDVRCSVCCVVMGSNRSQLVHQPAVRRLAIPAPAS